jgi:hypothetical protein
VNDPISLYVTVVVLGALLTVLVGALLYRNGEPFLDEVFADQEKARSVNRLLVVLFNLVVLGILALFSVVDVPWVSGAFQIVVTKLGVVLLVLGIAHGTTMVALSRIRARRVPQTSGGVTVAPVTRPAP